MIATGNYKQGLIAGLLTLMATGALGACPRVGEAHLAIIIDDLGYNHSRGFAVAELPAPITLAILPQTPHAKEIAELGLKRGKEIMVHMPMTSSHTEVGDPLLLSANLTPDAFEQVIEDAVSAVPGATGMNNHMGSALTENRQAMEQFMARLKTLNMFFIDSRTTAATVAGEVASDMLLPTASRSVFLDNERDRQLIREHLTRAVETARKTGGAIAIGHPYPETVEVLTEDLPRLPDEVTLTRASEIARCATAQRLTSMP